MSSLSGLLSLNDALNTESPSFPSLNPQKLELGPMEESHVRHSLPSYYQPILYDGNKLVLQTPAVHMSCLTYKHYSAGEAIYVPISPWLRQQFDIIDDYVRDHVTIPDDILAKWPYGNHRFKAIWESHHLNLIMNESCCITQDTKDGVIELSTTSRPTLGEGVYSLTLEFPHVYIGWHDNDVVYSVNYRVNHIHFRHKTLNVKETTPPKNS